jgi:Fe-S cluster biogenesis protein NfuA
VNEGAVGHSNKATRHAHRQPTTQTFDVEHVVQNARPVLRMLAGGLDIVGVYVAQVFVSYALSQACSSCATVSCTISRL